MSNSTFYARQEASLELAWARAFLEQVQHPAGELAPFSISIAASSGLTLPDTLAHPLAKALDASMKQETGQEIEKVAFALFPERLWKISGGDRQAFYAEYLRNQSTYVGWEPHKNKGGTYFGRLIGFGVDHRTGKDLGFKPSKTLTKDGNQLEHVIRQCKRSAERGRSVARMQLQATTFDPYRDLTTSGQPCFPCLQQIAFDPDIKAGGLALTAFYATQQLFVKAYGNWLGLCRLGSFVAGESGLRLTRFSCFVGVQKMDVAPRAGRLRTRLVRAAEEVVGQRRMKADRWPPMSAEPRVDRDRASSFSPGVRAGDSSPEAEPPRIAPLKPTPVYNSYWRFAAERQRVFFARASGLEPPWTDDEIIAAHKFTNAYRASDRVSQYLIRRVIYREDLPTTPEETFFRILLFKFFNKIETWDLLERELGPPTWEGFDFDRLDDVLTRAMAVGRRIYSAAYIMPSAGAFGHDRKHRNHLALLRRMMVDDLPARISEASDMQHGFELLLAYPSMGDFLAYQYITDINYSVLTRFSESAFVVAGPGALDGISKCFADTAGLNPPEIIRFMADRQESEFERLGLTFRSLWGRRLQLIDCQNLFCEVGKYARLRHPEIAGTSGRTRIKQKFRPTETPIDYWYPPKWGIDAGIIGR